MLSTDNVTSNQPQSEHKLRVRFIRNTIAQKQQVLEGDVLDLPEQEARFIVAAGKAVFVKEDAAPEVAIETADVKPEAMESTDVKSPRKKRG